MPAYARLELAELLNTKTGCFKRELTVSLRTSDPREATPRHEGGSARQRPFRFSGKAHCQRPPGRNDGRALDLEELRSNVLAELLAADFVEREDGDDRRRLQSAEERAQWPDFIAVPDANAKGMSEDHLVAYGSALDEFEPCPRRRARSAISPSAWERSFCRRSKGAQGRRTDRMVADAVLKNQSAEAEFCYNAALWLLLFFSGRACAGSPRHPGS